MGTKRRTFCTATAFPSLQSPRRSPPSRSHRQVKAMDTVRARVEAAPALRVTGSAGADCRLDV